MGIINKIISNLKKTIRIVQNIERYFDEIKINQGIILSHLNETKSTTNLKDYEFKVFSQWGEDGIIQNLIKKVEIKNKTFIEFGVEDFSESNCRFLLMKDDWKGFVIDGSTKNIQRLRNSYFYWKHHIEAVDEFITKGNIENILRKSNFENDLGILSIDLDGIDYYVLKAINNFKPRILICEFNPVFGGNENISVPYRDDFQRTKANHTNLYFGASLGAITYLANKKGYSLVGTNTAGNNAFYVRNDLLNDNFRVLSVEEAYSNSNYRESRYKDGNLSFLTQDQRVKEIKGLPIYDVEKKIIRYFT